MNYGAIGVVISHEMTHGFDDQGRLFDKDGNMNNWWTDEDAAAFKVKTDILVDQFNKVEVLDGVFANGAATLGENRVNASIRNLQTFFDAFGIKEGDAMWRPVEDRVIIW